MARHLRSSIEGMAIYSCDVMMGVHSVDLLRECQSDGQWRGVYQHVKVSILPL